MYRKIWTTLLEIYREMELSEQDVYKRQVFEVVEDEAKENLYQVMTLHEYRKMIESPDKEVRFRYLPF